ncbi:reverse transcriptase domain-containing protein [Rhodoferax sediminis]|uniref:reverse transcriptase domain-containing protein n=1 Tax=Rhodoferax sediminis TaxID=2509614 RepID=UPI001FCEA971|nr:reverse transcriptase domain-containing protein [Rhodoferax sediminis]
MRPLSPLLSNILLTDLDRELERRKLSFCRYADDCNIYVSSQRTGQRIMAGVRSFLVKRLKLTVNETKSAVARPWVHKFLGYSVTVHQASKIRIAKQSIERLKGRMREPCRQGRGRSTGPDHRDAQSGSEGMDELLQPDPEPAAC